MSRLKSLIESGSKNNNYGPPDDEEKEEDLLQGSRILNIESDIENIDEYPSDEELKEVQRSKRPHFLESKKHPLPLADISTIKPIKEKIVSHSDASVFFYWKLQK
mmetsp:Transcript_31246/g.23225  ORF Transcript_31246/g.23225 Transcript_31246/m.23225 type:complete len:105 (+) Transcript_31246:214-528(+)